MRRASGDVRSVAKAGRDTGAGLRAASAGMDRLRESSRSTGVQLRHLVGLAAGYKIASGFRQAVAAGFEFNAMQDRQRVGFTTLLGSQQRAADMMREIQALSLRSPVLDPGTTGDAVRSMLAYGVASRDVLGDVERLGDMSAASGKDIHEAMTLGARAMGQISSRGRLSMEELNQLSDSVGLSQKAIRKELGMTQAEFAATFTPGNAITAAVALPAIRRAMEAQSKGAADLLSKTPTGQIQAARERGSIIAGAVTKSIRERIGRAAGDISTDLQGIWTTKRGGLRTDTTLEEKLGMSRAAIGKVTGPLAEEFSVFWRKHHVGDRISAAFESTMTTLANKAGAAAPKVLGAFARAWWNAGVWGKLITAGFLLSKLGAFRFAGTAAATMMGGAFKRRFAQQAVGEAIAANAAGGMGRSGRWGGAGSKIGGILGKTAGAAMVVGLGLAIRDWAKSMPALDQYSGSKGWGELFRDVTDYLPGEDSESKRARERARTPGATTAPTPLPAPRRPGRRGPRRTQVGQNAPGAHAARAGARGRVHGDRPLLHVEVVSQLKGRELGRGVATVAADDIARG